MKTALRQGYPSRLRTAFEYLLYVVGILLVVASMLT
jgi:hypothetical protein